jgi:phage gpG-like protein
MLSAQISINPDLTAAIKGLKPDVIRAALARGLDRGAMRLVGKITQDRLTGKGPFPVPQQRLGVRSGRLRQSVRASQAKANGDQVSVSIGSAVRYAALHEFGWSGVQPVRAHQRTVRKIFGQPLAQPLTMTVRAHQRKVTIPERRPFRAGIESNVPALEAELERAVTQAMQGNTTGGAPTP